jgi:hypothetical protein
LDDNDVEDNLSQPLEYWNSLRHELVFDSTWDQELEGEAIRLIVAVLAGDHGLSSTVLDGIDAQGCDAVLGGLAHRGLATSTHMG